MHLRIQRVRYISWDDDTALPGLVDAKVRHLFGHDAQQITNILTIAELFSLASATKDETWQHEDEVRLTFSSSARPSEFEGRTIFPIAVLPDGSPVLPEDPLYRDRHGVRVPYHMKHFGRWDGSKWNTSRAIAEIMIGPNNTESIDDVVNHMSHESPHFW
jgi:hypothetical protein